MRIQETINRRNPFWSGAIVTPYTFSWTAHLSWNPLIRSQNAITRLAQHLGNHAAMIEAAKNPRVMRTGSCIPRKHIPICPAFRNAGGRGTLCGLRSQGGGGFLEACQDLMVAIALRHHSAWLEFSPSDLELTAWARIC